MKRNGFTLIEVICVLGICGIIFGIVSINSRSIVRQIDDYKFKNACLNLISDLRYAKTCALTHGYVRIIFNENGYDINYCTFSNSTIKKVKFNNGIELNVNIEDKNNIYKQGQCFTTYMFDYNHR